MRGAQVINFDVAVLQRGIKRIIHTPIKTSALLARSASWRLISLEPSLIVGSACGPIEISLDLVRAPSLSARVENARRAEGAHADDIGVVNGMTIAKSGSLPRHARFWACARNVSLFLRSWRA